jgi:hypothetical protein
MSEKCHQEYLQDTTENHVKIIDLFLFWPSAAELSTVEAPNYLGEFLCMKG